MTESDRREAPRPQAPFASPPFHVWHTLAGENWLEFHRRGRDIVLRFPGLADFTVSTGGKDVICIPVPEADEETLQHLFLNQVLPLVMNARGCLSFHGSAVDVGGACAAFLGPTGRGKSTLAASFATMGQGFLTDDGLIVALRGGRHVVEPSHPSLRLWEDSEAALLPTGSETAEPVSYTSKSRFVAGERLAHAAAELPLAAIFVLGEQTADAIAIRRLSQAETVVAVLGNCFQIDVEDRQALARQFVGVTGLCEAVPGFSLDYPRQFGLLPAVRAAIMAEIAALGTAT